MDLPQLAADALQEHSAEDVAGPSWRCARPHSSFLDTAQMRLWRTDPARQVISSALGAGPWRSPPGERPPDGFLSWSSTSACNQGSRLSSGARKGEQRLGLHSVVGRRGRRASTEKRHGACGIDRAHVPDLSTPTGWRASAVRLGHSDMR